MRLIFARYLELGSLGKLLDELRERGILTKVRHLSNGGTIGAIPFTRGPLAYLLRNRFYVGSLKSPLGPYRIRSAIPTGVQRVRDAVGCPWRLLPSDFPPWRTVYRWFAAWRDEGLVYPSPEALND